LGYSCDDEEAKPISNLLSQELEELIVCLDI